MKARALFLCLVLCLFGVAVCFAQDAFTGTWKLNEAKSKIGPGMAKIGRQTQARRVAILSARP